MSETAENLREPDADAPGIVPPSAPEPATVTVRPSYRAAVLALALALIVVAGLVAAAPWWAPLVPWGPQAVRAAALARRLDGIETAANKTLHGLEERVAGLETRQPATPPGLGMLRQQVDKELQANGLLAQRVAALENAAKAPAGAALEQRVAALENASKNRADTASDLGKRVATIEGAAKDRGAALGALDKRLAALAAQVHGAASEAENAGLAVALLRISEAVQAGRPFAAEYEALRRLARGRPAIEQAAAPLADAASAGVASRAALARDLHAIEAKLAATPPAAPATGGWAAQAWHGLRGLVRIRRAGAPPSGAEAVVAAAGKALAAGDLTGAIDKVASLTGGPADAAGPWLRAARQRLAAEQALSRLETAVAASSGKTGAGPATPDPATSSPAAAGGGAPG